MSDRTNRKVVKYRKVYKITVDGSTDTVHPEQTPFGFTVVEEMLKAVVMAADQQFKNRNVTLEEIV